MVHTLIEKPPKKKHKRMIIPAHPTSCPRQRPVFHKTTHCPDWSHHIERIHAAARKTETSLCSVYRAAAISSHLSAILASFSTATVHAIRSRNFSPEQCQVRRDITASTYQHMPWKVLFVWNDSLFRASKFTARVSSFFKAGWLKLMYFCKLTSELEYF